MGPADSAWHWDPDDRYVDDLTTIAALEADAAAAVDWFVPPKLRFSRSSPALPALLRLFSICYLVRNSSPLSGDPGQ